ncbi:hypothetical protein ZWY2020_042320 [Hordeum vulgare]|nr:hypothetical protein ZWY2020_042320 [Hordeum vulgare]
MHPAIRAAGKTTAATAHARSASLPHEHPHPVLAHLDDSIHALRSWLARGAAGQSSGIALVDATLAALGELLALPQAVAALHAAAATACDQILEMLLVLADAYSTFLSALVTLKQSAAELQVGTRHGDGAMVAASPAHRRTEKEPVAVTTMRHTARGTLRTLDAKNSEVIGIVADEARHCGSIGVHRHGVCSDVSGHAGFISESAFKQVAGQAERQAAREEGSTRDSDGGIGEVGEVSGMH